MRGVHGGATVGSRGLDPGSARTRSSVHQRWRGMMTAWDPEDSRRVLCFFWSRTGRSLPVATSPSHSVRPPALKVVTAGHRARTAAASGTAFSRYRPILGTASRSCKLLVALFCTRGFDLRCRSVASSLPSVWLLFRMFSFYAPVFRKSLCGVLQCSNHIPKSALLKNVSERSLW